MKSFRNLALGSTLAISIFTVLGACSSDSPACGANGATNGTCQPGPSCPSGQIEISISDPFDSCGGGNSVGGPGQICCAPGPDAVASPGVDASSVGTQDATGSHHDATTVADAANEATPTNDAAHTDSTTPAVDAHHVPDATPVDSGLDSGMDSGGHTDSATSVDAGAHLDGSHVDGSHADGSASDAHADSGKACGGGATCTLATDCPTPASVCITATCTAGCCGTTNTALGTACTDNGGVVCNGGVCVSSHCSDGKKDDDETDVDCGGSCGATCTSTPAESCKLGSDCVSLVCGAAFTCQAATCSDGVKNGNETGVDCGGVDCDAAGKTCAATKACGGPADCTSGLCVGNVCSVTTTGQACAADKNCATGSCVSGVCCGTTCAGQCQACSMALTGLADGTCGSVANGTGCNDDNACTKTDTCQVGVCTGSNLTTCSAADACHIAGTCDATTGACSMPNAPDGTACSLGACYSATSCTAGVCGGTFCSSNVCGSSLAAFAGAQTPKWNFNGTATYDAVTETVVLVDGTGAEAGTVVYADAITADTFTVSFDFLLTTTNGRADGIAFMLETDGPTALGSGYGGFGVLGLHGYATELDIFDSASCDGGNGNHAGIDLLSACLGNGGIPSPIATSGDLYDATMANNGVGDIGDGDWRTETVSLSNGELSVSITGSTGTVIPVGSLQNVALPAFVSGTPYYFGFGAGSGSNGQNARAEIRNVAITFPANRCL